MSSKPQRFMELEGIRGVAAIAVAIYHNLLAFFAFAYFGEGVQHKHFEAVMHGHPLAAFLSGTFAVAIFFVLSGFVLSIGFIQTKRIDIVKGLAAKRYLRLMLPALASVVICYILIKLGQSHTQTAGAITQSKWLLNEWNFDPTLFMALRNGTFEIFTVGQSAFNNVLWTMIVEFAGSFLIFGTMLICGSSKYRWVVYAGLAIVTFNTWYLAFVIGLLLAELYNLRIVKEQKRNLLLIFMLLSVAIVLGGYPIGDTSGSLYEHFKVISFEKLDYRTLSLTLGAAMLIFVILWSTQIAHILRKPYISKIGKYTFALYLIHIPILYSFTTWVFVEFTKNMGYTTSAILAMLASMPLVIIGTILFERYIDRPSVKFSTFCANIFYEKQNIQLPKSFEHKWGAVHGAERAKRFIPSSLRSRFNISDSQLDE